MRKRAEPITPDDVPVLPPFKSSPFDVKVHLEGDTEVIKVMARGRAAAMMTALYTVQRWPPEKIAQLKSMELSEYDG